MPPFDDPGVVPADTTAPPTIADSIKAAQAAGHSDADIADYLKQSKTFGPAYQKAHGLGYSDDAIFGHYGLSLTPPASVGAEQGAWDVPGTEGPPVRSATATQSELDAVPDKSGDIADSPSRWAAPTGGEFGDVAAQPWARGEQPQGPSTISTLISRAKQDFQSGYANQPGYTYGNVLPFRQNDRTGEIEWGYAPEVARQLLQAAQIDPMKFNINDPEQRRLVTAAALATVGLNRAPGRIPATAPEPVGATLDEAGITPTPEPGPAAPGLPTPEPAPPAPIATETPPAPGAPKPGSTPLDEAGITPASEPAEETQTVAVPQADGTVQQVQVKTGEPPPPPAETPPPGEVPTDPSGFRSLFPNLTDEQFEALFHQAAKEVPTVPWTPELAPSWWASVRDVMTRLMAGSAGQPQPTHVESDAADVNVASPPPPEQATDHPPYAMFDPRDLTLAPKVFQYKESNEQGVTGALRGVTRWEPALANPITVWQGNDGRTYVVNGHQRTDLALRAQAAGQPDVLMPAQVFREADGYTPEYMRALGAFQNISEGSGTAIDAAKVLRGKDAIPDSMRLPDLPPGSELVRQGTALAKLSPDAFGMVTNEIVPAAYAAHVGDLIADPQEQLAAMQVLAQGDPANSLEARTMVRDALNSGFVKGVQGGLFGEEAFAHSLIPERAKVLTQALRALRRVGGVYRAAVEGEESLTSTGNQMNTAANTAARTENGQLLDTIQRDATTRGPLSDALSRAASDVASGKPVAAAASRFLAEARNIVRSGSGQGVQPGDLSRRAEHPAAPGAGVGSPEAVLRELDARGAPDTAYRDMLSTGTKTPLRRGETWRDRAVRFVESTRPEYREELPGELSAGRKLPTPPPSGPDLFGVAKPEAAPRPASEPTIRDDQRQQTLEGMEPSAVQAQATRDAAGPRGGQKPADEGLFAHPEPVQPSLPAPRTSRWPHSLNFRDQLHEIQKAGHQAAADWVFDQGRETNHEHVAIVDNRTGQIIHAGTNGFHGEIKWKSENGADLPADSLTIHHNHPNDTALSGPDLGALANPAVSHVVAHGHGGTTTTASLTPEFAAKRDVNTISRDAAALRNLSAQALPVSERILMPLVRAGKIGLDVANHLYEDVKNRILAAQGVIRYTSTAVLPDVVRQAFNAELERINHGHGNYDRFTVAVRAQERIAGLRAPEPGTEGTGGPRGGETGSRVSPEISGRLLEGEGESLKAEVTRQTDTPEFKRWFGGSKVVDAQGKPLVMYHGTKGDIGEAFNPSKRGTHTASGGSNEAFFFTSKPTVAETYATHAPRQDYLDAIRKLTNERSAILKKRQDRIDNPNFNWGSKRAINGLQDLQWKADDYNFAIEMLKNYAAKPASNMHNAQYIMKEYAKIGPEMAVRLGSSGGEVLYPTYLSLQNPVIIHANEKVWHELPEPMSKTIADAKAAGHDGVIFKDIYDPLQSYMGEKGVSDVAAVFSPTQIKSAIGNRGTFDPDDPNILRAGQPLTPPQRRLLHLFRRNGPLPPRETPNLIDQGPPRPAREPSAPTADSGGLPFHEPPQPPRPGPGHNQPPDGPLFAGPKPPEPPPLAPEVEAARIVRPEAVKNLNEAEKYMIFPRTLASLDEKSARLLSAWEARSRDETTNAAQLRAVIQPTLLKLSKEERLKVAGALEIARVEGPENLIENPDGTLTYRNMATPFARWSKVGETVTLTPRQTKAYHEAVQLGEDQWTMLMRAAARRYGWDGDLDPAKIREAADQHGEPEDYKKLNRLADLLDVMRANRPDIYFPMQRFGSHFIAIRPREGEGIAAARQAYRDELRAAEQTHGLGSDEYRAAVAEASRRLHDDMIAAGADEDTASAAMHGGGHPPLAWFETVEKPMLQDILGISRGRLSVQAVAAKRIAELRGDFPEGRFDIQSGDWIKTPDLLRQLNIPAIQKLFMLLENKARAEVIDQVMRGDNPPTTKAGVREEAKTRYDALHGATLDAFYDAMFEELKAGFRRRARVVPGYSENFDRALGSHLYHIARNAAGMVHHDAIEAAFQDIQERHPHRNVKTFWKNWRAYQEDPDEPLSRAANTLNQIGFAYILGMNPASTFRIAMHGPMMAMPVLSVGVGSRVAVGAITRGLARAYAAIRGDTQHGIHVDLNAALRGMPPAKQAFLRQMATEGRLAAVGTHDLEALNDRFTTLLPGRVQDLAKRGTEMWTSNVHAMDMANRFAVASAAWDIGSIPRTLNAAATPLMQHNALFRDTVRREGLSPETYGRFMLSQAAFDWGKQNKPPMMRGPLGTLAFSLHGFVTRALSKAWELSKNSGAAGRYGAMVMASGLFLGAGALGLPYVEDSMNVANKVWETFAKRDPDMKNKVRDFIQDHGFGQVGADIVLNGPVPTAFGVNFGIGLGDVLSRQFDSSNLVGTIPAILWQAWHGAGERAASRQAPSAIAAEMAPGAFRPALRAEAAYKQGVLDRQGRPIIEKGQVPPGEIARLATGFRPLTLQRQSEEKERYHAAQNQEAWADMIRAGQEKEAGDEMFAAGWSNSSINHFIDEILNPAQSRRFQRFEEQRAPP